jgi:hypothetical protein
MLVDSLWDQEDIYGALAVYRALEPKDPDHKLLYLVIGPWHHGQEIENASSLGAIPFHSDTGLYFREHILAPFLAHYLKDDAPPMQVSPVTAYETGADRWENLEAWPSGCADGCRPKATPLYLHADGGLSFTAPSGGEGYDEYVSDPARPVPYRVRPSQPVGYVPPLTWVQWLVDDQRPFSGRTDVVTFTSEPLTQPLKISGAPIAHLMASTTGTDADWVVKLIDVYPDEVAGDAPLGGYQLPISMDILRGRYRKSLSQPEAITPNQPLMYQFALPAANHVFLPGHRIMVQVQSSWFPLYDRNPQTFVPNIFFARPSDYKKATMRVYHDAGDATYVDLPVVPADAAQE